MKVLLISVQPSLDIIGLRILHHLLLDHGHDSRLLFAPRFDDIDANGSKALQTFAQEFGPGLIGVSLMSADFHRAVAITKILRTAVPAAPVLWGGIHATAMPEMCAEHADYVCVGEGETSLLDAVTRLAAGEPLDGVENLCYLRNGELLRNPLSPLVENLDEFPIISPAPPNSFVLEIDRVSPVTPPLMRKYMKYKGGVYKIITSRGCPYACSYCCNNLYRKTYGHWGIRRRSVEHVLKEVELALREGPPIAYVDFTDDCFLGHDMEYFRDFCAKYKERIGKPFAGRGTPREITRERIEAAVDAGMAWINVGLQSGSDRVCREVYHRAVPRAAFEKASRILAEFPVAVVYDVIVDNPFETPEDAMQTAELLASTPRPFQLVMYSLSLYFGTELRERVRREIPERLHDSFTKNHYVREPSTLNRLIDVTPSLPSPWLRRLIRMNRSKPDAFSTRAATTIAWALCKVLFHPIVYFRLVLRSQRGSLLGALRVMPILADFGVTYYLNGLNPFKRRKTRL
jgi:radical SAM superfamily enzyme YgiQ (UPF0313 family)